MLILWWTTWFCQKTIRTDRSTLLLALDEWTASLVFTTFILAQRNISVNLSHWLTNQIQSKSAAILLHIDDKIHILWNGIWAYPYDFPIDSASSPILSPIIQVQYSHTYSRRFIIHHGLPYRLFPMLGCLVYTILNLSSISKTQITWEAFLFIIFLPFPLMSSHPTICHFRTSSMMSQGLWIPPNQIMSFSKENIFHIYPVVPEMRPVFGTLQLGPIQWIE